MWRHLANNILPESPRSLLTVAPYGKEMQLCKRQMSGAPKLEVGECSYCLGGLGLRADRAKSEQAHQCTGVERENSSARCRTCWRECQPAALQGAPQESEGHTRSLSVDSQIAEGRHSCCLGLWLLEKASFLKTQASW